MKRVKNIMKRQRKINTNTKRRMMLKKLHQRVLVRRKQFALSELNEGMQQAC
jgi:hypothetical protein